MILKQSILQTVPVKLIDADNPPYGTNNIAASWVTVYYSKEDGVSTQLLVDGTNWKEVNASYQTGEYRLGLPASILDQSGWFSFTLSGISLLDYADRFKIEANLLADVASTVQEILEDVTDINLIHGTVQTIRNYVIDINSTVGDIQTDVNALSGDITDAKAGILGKKKLDLAASPPEHTVYKMDGVTVLQRADVIDSATGREYRPK